MLRDTLGRQKAVHRSESTAYRAVNDARVCNTNLSHEKYFSTPLFGRPGPGRSRPVHVIHAQHRQRCNASDRSRPPAPPTSVGCPSTDESLHSMTDASDQHEHAPIEWPHDAPLVRGGDDPLLAHLASCFPRASQVWIAVAFILDRGVELLHPYFQELLETPRQGRLRLLTGDYFDVTQPRGLRRLLDLDGERELRVFETAGQAFNPKAYIFHYPNGEGVAFVGSSNLSASALGNGVEWNYRIVRSADARGFGAVIAEFEKLNAHPKTVDLSEEWIAAYETRRQPEHKHASIDVPAEQLAPAIPTDIQREALAALRASRATGNRAGLVVMATGLGNTWLSAFDAVAFARESDREPGDVRILFVAHRDEILDQARGTFRRILPDASMGKYTGTERAPSADVLFASIQTLSRDPHLHGFAADAFDYIIVDEFHHAAATTYRKILEHFTFSVESAEVTEAVAEIDADGFGAGSRCLSMSVASASRVVASRSRTTSSRDLRSRAGRLRPCFRARARPRSSACPTSCRP